jgi:MFS family permease
MIFPAIYGGFTLMMFWALQPMMTAAMVPVALFGLFVGINQGSRAMFSKIAHKAKQLLGVKKLLFICLGLLAAGFISAIFAAKCSFGNMALIYALSGFVAVIPATQTMAALIFNDYIHNKIKSNERGTVLSISSMFNTGISGAMMILAKPMLDNFGIVTTLLVCLGALIVILFPLKKVLAIKGIEK